ncbi:MAG: hypothetical protein MK116_05300 [Phycisphaerales bacterium]|nr:hypothetical protein [Phycisphaerales bacterium]
MNTTKALSLATCGLLTGIASGSPFQSIGADLVNVGDQGYTYRLYVNLDAGARIDAVYGNATGSLIIAPGEGNSFYQDPTGGNTSQAINSAFFQFVPALEWDSYVSIGALYQNGDPFGSNELNEIGIDWTSFEAGLSLETDNGSWFVTPDDPQGQEVDGRVFIAQLTLEEGPWTPTISEIGFGLQGKDADGNTWNYYAGIVPAPGMLGMLGLVAITGSRRRRD